MKLYNTVIQQIRREQKILKNILTSFFSYINVRMNKKSYRNVGF